MELAENVILSVGGKGLETLVPAVGMLERPCDLVVLGKNEPPSGLSDRVKWVGKVDRSRMPEFYAVSDCLAHLPVADLWPHAINEALSAGIPVVASRWTGVPDSVLSGPGCRIVMALDPPSIARALDEALDASHALGSSGRAAIRDCLRPYDVSAMAERFLAAAASVER